ncbi:MAG: FecR domain-containing protein [Chitinophagaceae bacterium]|nr:FecR domain-containing protein [Chitinophagaceae bacterium]
MKNYKDYTENEFVMDADFLEWVKHPSEESEVFWASFIKENPQKKEELYNAKKLLLSMVFKQNLLQSEKEAMWQEIRTAMRKQKEGKLVFMKTGRNSFSKMGMYVVAALLLGCVLFLSLYYFTEKKPEYVVTTQFAEIKKFLLPDSSFIILNANSNIKYSHQWNNVSDREVWIDGEAFFSVRHTKTNQKFIVHTNEADIEVLGTEFNVMERDEKIKVSLNSGSVKISVYDNANPVFLIPGDILELNAKKIQKGAGKVEDISVWKENKLVFDDTPLSEILKQLRYIYGWEFATVPNDVLNEKLTGEVETKDEKVLLKTLERALRIEITKQGNTIHISRLQPVL